MTSPYEDELIRYYKVSDQLRENREAQKYIKLEIRFLELVKSMVEKQMARGVPEQEAFDRVKKIALMIAEIAPPLPKDPLQ